MRGAATGALAFTVGGVEVLLTAPEARAQNVPFRLLKAGQTHEILNLYIAGPGIFATAGASTRPIRSLLYRCAGPGSWHRNGPRSPADGSRRRRPACSSS